MKIPFSNMSIFSPIFGETSLGGIIDIPPENIPNLLAWYDASDASTITAPGNNVSQWLDKSGNGNHLSQGIGANRPNTNDKTINGLNAISFDGSNDFLELESIITTPDFTIAIVFHIESVSNDSDSIFALNSNEAGDDDFQIGSGDTPNFFAQFQQTGLEVEPAPSFSPTDLVGSDTGLLYRLQVSNSSCQLYDNSGLVEQVPGYNGFLDNDQHLLIGINRGASLSPVHYIGEIVLVNGAISVPNRIGLFNYCANKWGV